MGGLLGSWLYRGSKTELLEVLHRGWHLLAIQSNHDTTSSGAIDADVQEHVVSDDKTRDIITLDQVLERFVAHGLLFQCDPHHTLLIVVINFPKAACEKTDLISTKMDPAWIPWSIIASNCLRDCSTTTICSINMLDNNSENLLPEQYASAKGSSVEGRQPTCACPAVITLC